MASPIFVDLVRAAHATLLIVGNEIAGPLDGWPRSLPFNLIVVSERRGQCFTAFLRKLFASMFEGTGIALSWVKLSPQTDGPGNPNDPISMCIPTISGLCFAPATR